MHQQCTNTYQQQLISLLETSSIEVFYFEIVPPKTLKSTYESFEKGDIAGLTIVQVGFLVAISKLKSYASKNIVLTTANELFQHLTTPQVQHKATELLPHQGRKE